MNRERLAATIEGYYKENGYSPALSEEAWNEIIAALRERSEAEQIVPEIFDVGEHHELWRQPMSQQWSLRRKLPDGDVTHVRYLDEHEVNLLDGLVKALGARYPKSRPAKALRATSTQNIGEKK